MNSYYISAKPAREIFGFRFNGLKIRLPKMLHRILMAIGELLSLVSGNCIV